jgi:drug/metabolite transporter (DMT)-like permease
MDNMKRARGYMILSMAIFGTLGPFTRQVALTSGALALCRAVMASALLGGYLLLRRQLAALRSAGRELPLLLLSGAAMGVNWILLFEAYKYTTVSVATLSYYFAPVLVMLLAPLLFREKRTWRQVLCFVMSTLGLVLMTGVGDLSAGGAHLKGVLFGLGAAVFYAAVMLLNKLIRGVSGLHRTFLQFLAAIAVLAPYVALTGGVGLERLDGPGWGCLAVIGLVHTGLTYCMYFSALKALPGQEAAILSYVDPLVAVLVSVAVLHEAMTPRQLLGGGLILGFTLWNELGALNKEAAGDALK